MKDHQIIRARLIRRHLEYLAERVSEVSGVPLERLLGRDRHKSVARARVHLYAVLRETGLSYPQIGQILDRDHTTVLKQLQLHFPERFPRRSR